MRARKQRQRGYTIVELLMALAIFGVGVTGVVALQKVTGASNQHARNLALANHAAQSWLERLTVDANDWIVGAPQNTVWLSQVGMQESWFQPVDGPQADIGAAFGALGQPLVGQPANQTVFCTHLRLTLLNSPLGATNVGLPVVQNNGLIRAEVRVFWPRHADAPANYCTPGNEVNIGQDVQSFHFVYHTTAIRQSVL